MQAATLCTRNRAGRLAKGIKETAYERANYRVADIIHERKYVSIININLTGHLNEMIRQQQVRPQMLGV